MTARGVARRYEVAEVAVRLFSERGYDAVTVEEIATEAGIGVRTFFRHFPTKEHAAFPDHEERVSRFRQALQARAGTTDPLRAAVEVGMLNAEEYFKQPDLYRPRYRLVRNEAALRDHERIADREYELAVAEFLAKELGDVGTMRLVAPVVATTLVGAVNAVLDAWAFDQDADHHALLEAARSMVSSSARAVVEAATGSHATTTVETTSTEAAMVLVLSDDPDLRAQVASLLQAHRIHPRTADDV